MDKIELTPWEWSQIAFREGHGTLSGCRNLVRGLAKRGFLEERVKAIQEMVLKNEKRSRRKPALTVREALEREWKKRQRDMIRAARIVRKDGAGDLFIAICKGEFGTDADKSYGDRSSVASSYGYPVWDHEITVSMPRTYVLKDIGSLLTAVPFKPDATKPVAWLRKGPGLSLKWEQGFLVRGVHLREKTFKRAFARFKREQEKRVASLWASRQDRQEVDRILARPARVLVTVPDSLSAGNCLPGTESFRERLGAWLHAKRRVEKCRADIILKFAMTIGLRDRALAAIKQAARRMAVREVQGPERS